MWLYPTSTPGTGTVDFGALGGRLYAFGENEARSTWCTARRASTVSSPSRSPRQGRHRDGLRVRMTGDDKKNNLDAYGRTSSSGRRRPGHCLGRVGNGFDSSCPRRDAGRSSRARPAGPALRGADDDVLLGGRGATSPTARGQRPCVAEVRNNCER